MNEPTASHSPVAERAVVALMLTQPEAMVPQVVGTLLEPDHFHQHDLKVIFEAAVEAYYADERVTPLIVGDMRRRELSLVWNIDKGDVPRELQRRVGKMLEVTTERSEAGVVQAAKIVRQHADYRSIVELAQQSIRDVEKGELPPDQLAAELSEAAIRVSMSQKRISETLSYGNVGRAYIRHLHQLRAARAEGVELAAYFGVKFLDGYIRGLQPTELLICAGEPGAGKSAVWWKAAENFARRQMPKPPDQRVAGLVLSIEMGQIPSSHRLAQSITGVPGTALREGDVTDDQIRQVARQWAKDQNLPLYFDFASHLTTSQMRAKIVDAIRRWNVGFVVIDHFRQFDLDRRWYSNPNQEDEEKVKFLKQQLADDLNIAVVCLAHTVKLKDERGGKPRMADLRGSGQIAAHADHVCFVYRPYDYARDNERDVTVQETDATMIWEKNRHGKKGEAHFYAEMSHMRIDDYE